MCAGSSPAGALPTLRCAGRSHARRATLGAMDVDIVADVREAEAATIAPRLALTDDDVAFKDPGDVTIADRACSVLACSR